MILNLYQTCMCCKCSMLLDTNFIFSKLIESNHHRRNSYTLINNSIASRYGEFEEEQYKWNSISFFCLILVYILSYCTYSSLLLTKVLFLRYLLSLKIKEVVAPYSTSD